MYEKFSVKPRFLALNVLLVQVLSAPLVLHAEPGEVKTACPSSLAPLKPGDVISYERRAYTQADPHAEIVLEETPSRKYNVVLSYQSEEERGFRFENGVTDIYTKKDYAFLGTISKTGERKLRDPEIVLHWMPEEGLKPGMTWKTGYTAKYYDVSPPYSNKITYEATSKPTRRDVDIDGVRTCVDAIEVDMHGWAVSQPGGVVASWKPLWKLKMTYVYAKDLDLDLEHEYIEQDPFGKMTGKSNRIARVVGIKRVP